jgi:hypothetical protein
MRAAVKDCEVWQVQKNMESKGTPVLDPLSSLIGWLQ